MAHAKKASRCFYVNSQRAMVFSFTDYKSKINWYEGLFESVTNETIIGEASPIYSHTTLIPEIPARIYNYNPDAKIIYIVREPISRLKSVWRQTLSTGHWYTQVYKNYCDVEVPVMPKTFIKAVYEYPPFLEDCRYWTHLSNYRKFFEDKNILLLFFEDLKTNPQEAYKDVCTFLNISPVYDGKPFKKKNSSVGKMEYRTWAVKLRQNKMLFETLKTTLNALKINPKLHKKAIDYNVDITHKQKKDILKSLDTEIHNIMRYGNRNPNIWN